MLEQPRLYSWKRQRSRQLYERHCQQWKIHSEHPWTSATVSWSHPYLLRSHTASMRFFSYSWHIAFSLSLQTHMSSSDRLRLNLLSAARVLAVWLLGSLHRTTASWAWLCDVPWRRDSDGRVVLSVYRGGPWPGRQQTNFWAHQDLCIVRRWEIWCEDVSWESTPCMMLYHYLLSIPHAHAVSSNSDESEQDSGQKSCCRRGRQRFLSDHF